MADIETPLMLRLLWGGADIRHSFSLQENETGDIVVWMFLKVDCYGTQHLVDYCVFVVGSFQCSRAP